VETPDRQYDLFNQDWITAFVATGDLLRRDATPVAETLASAAAESPMAANYDAWNRLD